jgi:hypothetical protein
VLKQFWKEHRQGNWTVVPLFAYGLVPRKELCSPRSLSSALASLDLEPGSMPWMKWKALAEDLGVVWPTRFRRSA